MGFQGLTGFGGGATGLSMSSSGPSDPIITGGTIDVDSRPGYTIHTFTSSGSLVCPPGMPGGLNCELLVIGGGGAGGSCKNGDGGGGGGGAGAVYYSSSSPLVVGTIPVTIGGGGSYTPNAGTSHGNQGSTTTWAHPTAPITSIGGGGGGSTATGPNEPAGASTGGCGSGICPNYSTGASSDPGHPGGVDVASLSTNGWGNGGGNEADGGADNGGCGGGGAAAVGGGWPPTGAGEPYTPWPGGVGARYSTSGSTVYYGGGGGSGTWNGGPQPRPGGAGGNGGGGAGGAGSDGTSGTANTGGGGGGGGMINGVSGKVGGSGGSGFLILAYANF